jgi:hypothetical protein
MHAAMFAFMMMRAAEGLTAHAPEISIQFAQYFIHIYSPMFHMKP